MSKSRTAGPQEVEDGAMKPDPSESSILNSQNQERELPEATDVVVIGGGIHSLIYAIHTRKIELLHSSKRTEDSTTKEEEEEHPKQLSKITILEKASSPTYKIGESTLFVFNLWCRHAGISTSVLWRLFGPKDGLAFYYFSPDDEVSDVDTYTTFTVNRPPGDFVGTLQMERKISELLLTLYAQRLGVQVLHGHEVQVEGSRLGNDESSIKVKDIETGGESQVKSQLLIDASGRFRRAVSKESRLKRFEGWNTNAFWAYFEETGDESKTPWRFYETVNTNHICLAEGWAWVVRLPTWEGSPLPNLISMITHLLDLNAANTPPDAYPSVKELIQKFDLKFRWVLSIGFALRTDVVYPPEKELNKFGSCEAERKFNWIVSRYTKVKQLMSRHRIVKDLYGPGTTWFIRKNMAYTSPKVTGPGFLAIGDAVGFTNPLYSTGINCNLATSVYAAEMTKTYITAKNAETRAEMLAQYETFNGPRVENLNRLNTFNYLCMRSPSLGPLGPIWGNLIAGGTSKFQNAQTYTLENVGDKILKNWDWGVNEPEYIDFLSEGIKILSGPPNTAPKSQISSLREWHDKTLREVVASGKYGTQWDIFLNWKEGDMRFVTEMKGARRCRCCGQWRIMAGSETRNCPFCGNQHSVEDSLVYKRDPMQGMWMGSAASSSAQKTIDLPTRIRNRLWGFLAATLKWES